MNQTQIPFIGLLKADQDFPKTVHQRMAGFHNPPSCAMTRNRCFFLSLLTTGSDMWSIASVLHRHAGLFAVKGLVSTQMLRFFRCRLGAIDHNIVQNRLHLSNVMTVGSGDNDGERGTSGVHQDVPLGPLLFPDPLDWRRRTLEREGLWSLHHPYFASPRQSPVTRRCPSSQPATVQGKTRLAPTPGSSGGWRWGSRIALAAGFSTDNLWAVHRQCLQKPAGKVIACARHQDPAGISCSDFGKFVEPKLPPSPTKHLIRPMIEFCPMCTSGHRVPEVTCSNKHEMSRALSVGALQGSHRGVGLLKPHLVYG